MVMRHGVPRPKPPRKAKIRSLSAVLQLRDMAKKFPEFTSHKRGNEAIWEGLVRRNEACATYRVRIEALSGKRPRVHVVDPELRIPPENRLETHCFHDGSLCLHLHEQWTPDRFMADTIVPWISVWLINYEYWLATGQWHGEGFTQESKGRLNVQNPFD
jgi:hypothetical protein